MQDERWLSNLEEIRKINKENIGGEFIDGKKLENIEESLNEAELEERKKEDEVRIKREKEAEQNRLAEEALLKKIEEEDMLRAKQEKESREQEKVEKEKLKKAVQERRDREMKEMERRLDEDRKAEAEQRDRME